MGHSSSTDCDECYEHCNRNVDCGSYMCGNTNVYTPTDGNCYLSSKEDATHHKSNEWYIFCGKGKTKSTKNACFLWKTCGNSKSQSPYTSENGYRVHQMKRKMVQGWRYKSTCHTGMQFAVGNKGADGICQTEPTSLVFMSLADFY